MVNPEIQYQSKSSEPGTTGLHIDSQVGINNCNTVSSKTTPACQGNSKSGLGVELGKGHAGQTTDALDMEKKNETF